MCILGARCLFKVGMKKGRKTGNPAAKRAFPHFFGPLNFGAQFPPTHSAQLAPTATHLTLPQPTQTHPTPSTTSTTPNPTQPNKTHKALPTRSTRPNLKYVFSVPRSGARSTWLLTPRSIILEGTKADYDSSEP